MNAWLALIVIALASMRIVETIKEILPWPLRAWTKSLGSLLVSIPLAIWATDSSWPWQWVALLALGSSGLSAMFHEVRTYLQVRGDEAKITVMTRAGPQRRVRM